MTTAYSSLLGLALPVQGELSGTWGDMVDNGITQYVDIAVAGTQSITGDSNVTLSLTNGTSSATNLAQVGSGTTGSAQYAIISCTGARTALRTITVPAQSKIYTVINATTGGFSIKVVGAGPTTGVTIIPGESTQIAWNGSDFVKVGELGGDVSFRNVTVASLTDSGLTSGRVTYATTAGLLTDSANLLFNGTTLTANTLNLTNALGTSYGGTGLTSFTANGVVYASSTSALATGSALTFSGSVLSVSSAATTDLFTWAAGGAAKTGYLYSDSAGVAIGDTAGVAGNNTYYNKTSNYIANYINGSEQMRLTSTGLGIGTSSPSYKLDVSGTARFNNTFDFGAGQAITSGSGSYKAAKFGAASGAYNVLFSGSTAFNINDNADTTNLLVLTNSGNLGLGVTPSAWNTGKAFEINAVGTNLWGAFGNTYLNANNYYNAADKFAGTGYAVRYLQVPSNGQHQWLVSTASGTAGNPITFSQALTLDADGNLVVGATSSLFRLTAIVQGGADRNLFQAGISGVSNGLTIKFNNATSTTRVNITNLPTSSAGLASGDLYVLAGALMVA